MSKVIYFICEDKYQLTIEQEFFCWRYALHGVGMKAVREAYGQKSPQAQNTKAWKLLERGKIRDRIHYLQKQHHNKDIDLYKGPWDYYGRSDVGCPLDPGNSIKPILDEIRGIQEVCNEPE